MRRDVRSATQPTTDFRSTGAVWKRTTILPWAALGAGVVITFLVYRPDRNLPFDFLDFSELLPLLQSDSFAGRLGALLDYYVGQHGRVSAASLALLSAKWGVFGEFSPGWQLLRFVTMWSSIVLAYLVLRRVGIGVIASLIGSTVFLFSPPAVDAFTRLTMAEPGGTLLLFLICLLVARTRGPSRRLTLLIIGVLTVLLVFMKEMLVGTLVLPVAVAYAQPGGRSWTHDRRAATATAMTMGVAVLLSACVVLWAFFQAPDEAFAGDYGRTFGSASDVLVHAILALLPFDPGYNFPARLTGLALLSYVAIVTVGLRWHTARHVSASSRHLLLPGFALAFPVLGSLIYLPWPAYNRFYALPFLFGGALLAAVAFDAIRATSQRALVTAGLAWAVFLVAAAADATRHARHMASRQLANRAVVGRLAALHAVADTVYVASDQRVPAEWQGIGPTLERYGRAFELDMPTVKNRPCEESRTLAPAQRVAIMAYQSMCPGLEAPHPIVVEYEYFSVFRLARQRDAIRVDFNLPTKP